MDPAGINQTAEVERTVLVIQEMKKLLELQGELVVKLIESARVPGPADTMHTTGMGDWIDIHL